MTSETAKAPIAESDVEKDGEPVEMTAFEQASDAHHDGDQASLDDYFRSFMQRVGISDQRVGDADPAKPTTTKKATSESQKPVAQERRATDAASAEARRPAPQESTNRAAMRELAVSSARHAIGSSNAKLATTTCHHLIVAGCAVVLAMGLLAICDGAASTFYCGAVVALGTSLYFGLRFLRGLYRLGAFAR
jgi:hypothetical protein